MIPANNLKVICLFTTKIKLNLRPRNKHILQKRKHLKDAANQHNFLKVKKKKYHKLCLGNFFIFILKKQKMCNVSYLSV